MAPRITLVGGGSTHWTPSLLVDFLNTPSLTDAEVALIDLDADALPPMLALAEHLQRASGAGLQVRATTDLDDGLVGADYVVSQFSVGGFTSMRHDLEVPARYGVRQPVGDSVGPGGVSRALRSVPVLLGIARAMERVAPDATLLNVTNPLSALCRSVTRETSITTIGLCNELVGATFVLSLLLDCGMHEIDPVVGGVNHLPIITELRVGGGAGSARPSPAETSLATSTRQGGAADDGLARLRALLDDEEARGKPIWMAPPEQIHWRKRTSHPDWTKDDVIANVPIRIEMFERFGVLPGSSDTHVAEFIPGFCTARSDYGRDWNVRQYTIDGHMDDKRLDDEHVAELMASERVPRMPSGELVAPLLDGLVGDTPRTLPMNLPNRGQVTNVPEGVIVECMGIAANDGAHARDAVTIPGFLGEAVRRIAATEELTVEAALTGDPTLVLEAMLTDPYAGSIPYEDTVAMTEELLAATSDWLPQF